MQCFFSVPYVGLHCKELWFQEPQQWKPRASTWQILEKKFLFVSTVCGVRDGQIQPKEQVSIFEIFGMKYNLKKKILSYGNGFDGLI